MLHSIPSPSRVSIYYSHRRKRTPPPPPPLRAFSPVVCRATASSREPLEIETLKCRLEREDVAEEIGGEGGEKADEDEEEEKKDISGIYLPRQKYIPISKEDLLDEVLSLFKSEKEREDFRRFARCLDLILHAEHKVFLEEMRLYDSLIHAKDRKVSSSSNKSKKFSSSEEVLAKDGEIENFYNDFNFRSLFRSSAEKRGKKFKRASSVIPADFQHMFMKLLRNAQFEELSAQDLIMTNALNTDYLLTLPIYVDWKKASESNAIIFRRGYASEIEKGFLIIEKLDYLQSRLLQKILLGISRPLKTFGFWINEGLQKLYQNDQLQPSVEKINNWLEEQMFDSPLDQLEYFQSESSELPIWLASQRASLRYKGILSSEGPRGRLVRKFLTWAGFIPSVPDASIDFSKESEASENYLRPNFLPRITLTDIWRPASMQNCGNNVWKMLKTGVSILFSRSVLEEPAFQELILLYTEDSALSNADKCESTSLQLKIYERIPYPELPVVFPHKKLSFRILDTVRLDIASILGLSAYFVNYKFEDILSSPSAFLLDVVAISALILFITRVGLGYKQTWDRYQLLVNKTLYEKTLASGFGSVHFLLDASEQQQYKEAILAYAILICAENLQGTSHKNVADACEVFMFNKFQEKVEMPIENAIDTLTRLGIMKEARINGSVGVIALPSLEAYEALKRRWDDLVS